MELTLRRYSVLWNLKHEAIAACFWFDKTRAASFLKGFKNEPFHKFNGVSCFVNERCLSRKNQGEILSKILSQIKHRHDTDCLCVFRMHY